MSAVLTFPLEVEGENCKYKVEKFDLDSAPVTVLEADNTSWLLSNGWDADHLPDANVRASRANIDVDLAKQHPDIINQALDRLIQRCERNWNKFIEEKK